MIVNEAVGHQLAHTGSLDALSRGGVAEHNPLFKIVKMVLPRTAMSLTCCFVLLHRILYARSFLSCQTGSEAKTGLYSRQ